MKIGLIAAGLILTASGALAQGQGLQAPSVECRGLEFLVVAGLIDGGSGGDTSELTGIVMAGDLEICLQWLESYGYPGLWNPDCSYAFDVIADYGLPVELAGQEMAYLTDLLAPWGPETCANILYEVVGAESSQ
jgi:hypothetical protein